ncbi:MAG: GTP-binding protein YchF, partial [Parcubacteria group bacterium GW2011_GWB1_42_6]
IIRWDKLVEAGSWNQAKQNGLVRTEGKDYIFQDGDTAIFKFN